jgi:hypothetical protein
MFEFINCRLVFFSESTCNLSPYFAVQVFIQSRLNTIGIARQLGGKHYVYTPQVMLQASATSVDIFRSLVVVHRIVYEVNKYTAACNWKSFMKPALGHTFIMNRNVNSHVNVVSPSEIVDIVEKAYSFQTKYVSLIMDLFDLSGWDLSRFTFGTVVNRVSVLAPGKR